MGLPEFGMALVALTTPVVFFGIEGAVPNISVWGATGVTAFDAPDELLVPMPLVAVTVNVYAVPLLSPVTVMDVHGAVQLPVIDPGLLVAV